MKRGNTALKRGVGLASAFALAIAGAVIAAPAANAAPTLTAPTNIRATPIADAGLISAATGDLVSGFGDTPITDYATDSSTGNVPALGVSAGQDASGFQVFIPSKNGSAAFDEDDTFTVSLSAGATFAANPDVAVTETPVKLGDLATKVGVEDLSKVQGIQRGHEATAAVAADGFASVSALTKVNPVTAEVATNKKSITFTFEEDDPSIGNAVGAASFGYLITVSGVKLDVANTVAPGPITLTTDGSAITTIAFAAPYKLSAAGATYVRTGDPIALPDVTLAETSKVGFGTGTQFNVTATDSETGASVTYALGAAKGAGSDTIATSKTGTSFTTTASDTTRIESVTVSGQTVTGLTSGHGVVVTVTPDDSTAKTATNSGGSWSHTPNLTEFPSVTFTQSDEAPRIAGDNRYDTSAQIAGELVAEGAGEAVVLANGTDGKQGIDALSANFLAGVTGAPILLANSAATLPTETQDALKSLFKNSTGDNDGEATVYVMGKEDSVSAGASDQAVSIIKAAANAGLTKVNVIRIDGSNRFETSAKVTTQFKDDVAKINLGKGALKTAFLTSGLVNADALAAGGLSAGLHIPVLLSGVSSVDPSVAKAIKDLGIKQLVVLGGTDRIADSVLDGLKADQGVTNVIRKAGSGSLGRYDTAVLLNQLFVDNSLIDLGSSNSGTAYLAGGFADALTAGPLVAAGSDDNVLLTVPANTLPTSTVLFLSTTKAGLNSVVGLGGADRVAGSVITTAQTAIK